MKSTKDRIETLLSWSTSHHATLHSAVQVYQDPQTGLSFRVKPEAKASIQPLEPIVTLPTSLTLSYLNAVQPSPAFHPDFIALTPPHVVGRLFLIKEFLRGESSFWYPYIQALPQPADTQAWCLPPFWPEDEIELLDGTNVEIGLEKIKADVKRELKDAKALLSTHPLEDESPKFDEASLTKTLYQWAYCIFSSRSFRPSLVLSEEQQGILPEGVKLDDFSVLLPLFDIGNHDMTTEVSWQLYDTKTEAAHACELRINKVHEPGDQIFNNYSMKTNAELLLGYGFMIPATEDLHNDYIHVRKRNSSTEAPGSPGEYLIARRPVNHPSSLLSRAKQTLHIEPRSPLPPVLGSFQHVQHDMVWDIFCTFTKPEERAALIPLDDGEAEAGEAVAERVRQEKFFSGQVEGQCLFYLEQTVSVIQHKVLQELERLNETDVEVVGDDADLLSHNQKLALDYRERCRQVLEGTLTAMSEDQMLRFEDDDEDDDEEDE